MEVHVCIKIFEYAYAHIQKTFDQTLWGMHTYYVCIIINIQNMHTV